MLIWNKRICLSERPVEAERVNECPFFDRACGSLVMTGISRMLMTDTEKTREEKVFGQDVSREELEHVAG